MTDRKKHNPDLVPEHNRADDSLLSALSLVIRANVEYAKGVTDLISSDLDRDDKLNEIKDELKLLVSKTEKLIESQETLLKAIQSKDSIGQKYLDEKLEPLYKEAGLREDGSEYPPADRWVVKLQQAVQSKVFVVIATALVIWLAKIVLGNTIKIPFLGN